MIPMKARLRAALIHLSTDERERVLDQVLGVLAAPTPFMIEAGATVLTGENGCTPQALAERVWVAMMLDAQQGG